MNGNTPQFILPTRVDSYLATLNRLYATKSEKLLQEIVVNSKLSIQDQYEYDNWDGGIYGHAVTLSINENLYIRCMDSLEKIQQRIKEDLGKLCNIRGEYISNVFIEMEPTNEINWRDRTGLLDSKSTYPPITTNDLDRIWGEGDLRIFLSHKANFKKETNDLKKALAKCGISSFVAHVDIEPTEEWRQEIERALQSMDALVALLSSDFHDSDWTDQEVGVALGRGIPVIPVRLGKDPYGLMGKLQGLPECSWDDPTNTALKIAHVLHAKMHDKSKIQNCFIRAFSNSSRYEESTWAIRNLLVLMDALTPKQIDQITQAWNNNSQISDSFMCQKLLPQLLSKWTDSEWNVVGKSLRKISRISDTEVPF